MDPLLPMTSPAMLLAMVTSLMRITALERPLPALIPLVKLFVVDRYGLRDREGAEIRRIEGIDFATCCGLGNGSCERLAGCGAAARIGIIPDSRHPGAVLSVSGAAGKHKTPQETGQF
jgi:hypothetical protein